MVIFFNAEDDVTSLSKNAADEVNEIDLPLKVMPLLTNFCSDSNTTLLIITVGGSSVDLAYDAATGTFSVTNNAGATLTFTATDAEVQLLLLRFRRLMWWQLTTHRLSTSTLLPMLLMAIAIMSDIFTEGDTAVNVANETLADVSDDENDLISLNITRSQSQ